MKIMAALGLGFGITIALVACGDDTNNTNSSSASSSASSSGTGGGGGAAGGSAGLEIQTHLSPDGFVVNSHIVVGDTEALLVDGQFFSAQAANVVQLLQNNGKTLTTVFLTHAHPDHYLGMEVIRTAFPDAKFVTTAKVLADYNAKKDATLAAVQMNFPGQVPDKVVTFSALQGNTLSVDGHPIDVIELPMAGESEVAAGLVVKDLNAFISGDLLYNQAYLWTAECKLAGWISNLDAIKANGYMNIYPGHGDIGTATIFDEDKKYLQDVEPLLKAAATPDAAIMQIKAAYPTWTGDGLLQFSTQTYLAACK